MMFIIKCERMDVCCSDWLNPKQLTKPYSDLSAAIAIAIEFMPEDSSIPIYVLNKENGMILWDSSKEAFEDEAL